MKNFLENHREAKARILTHYDRLAEIAGEVGMDTLATDIRSSRIPKLENERFHLVVLGEFNHGKSTFVNALLGSEILPTGITPTTAAINHVVHSDSKYAKAVLSTGETTELSPAALADWVTVAGENSDKVNYVEVGYPAEILRENITLVDTPGVNDLNEARAEVTYGYVPRADAVIFLLDAGQALKDSEREFLASHVLDGSKDRLVFVLGKIDMLSEDEQVAVVKYVRDGLAKLVDEPVVYALSAKDWLEGKRDGSGFGELLAYLGRFLDTDRARVLIDNAAEDAGRTAAYLEQNLGVRVRAFDLNLAELEQRVASVREQLGASKKTLDALHGRIEAESAAIKAQVRLDLELFSKDFASALPEQIDAVDADDVKRYLGSFVEDKFKEWAQLEGAKVAALLEGLAETVIAVTNENVAAASSLLASRLGPEDTEVEIDIDSFKYDVGVYAVGALGTTVFLFVNTLAGGLLTLAVPILAIVLKSKIAGDIREQAKERVPAAVERAADAMGPHFDKCIDDFAGRLSGFVTAAGNALYKGISEILDKTIEERRAGEEVASQMLSETNVQIEAVRSVRKALETERAEIWKEAPKLGVVADLPDDEPLDDDDDSDDDDESFVDDDTDPTLN